MTDSSPSELAQITFVVDGEQVSVPDNGVSLLAALRGRLGNRAPKAGCNPQGQCGCCTVLVDGKSTRACLMLAVQAHGRSVETVESLAAGGDLHPIQAALARHHGLQCGYCTPGVAMTIKELVEDAGGRRLSDAEIRTALSGNLCRCTGYQGMVAAAKDVLDARAAHGETTQS